MTAIVNLKQKCSAPSSLLSSDVPVLKIAQDCIHCGACVQECGFLQNQAVPGQIAQNYLSGDKGCLRSAYSCSLCSLCVEVCPQHLPVAEMFLDFRREAVLLGKGRYSHHRPLRFYEKIGNSKLFTCYRLPQACDTIFFPGCALPGIMPDRILHLFNYLKEQIPQLGLVLDCCNKPSHDLGFQEQFCQRFAQKVDRLRSAGVKKVITTCPSCYQIFKRYGKGFDIVTAYPLLNKMEKIFSAPINSSQVFTVHDSCAIRFEDETHKAVRELADRKGLKFSEMNHSRRKTYCCGAGGTVHYLEQKKDSSWTRKRQKEAGEANMITYCAGCTSALGSDRAYHIIELLFSGLDSGLPSGRMSSAPYTYINRLLLKVKCLFLH